MAALPNGFKGSHSMRIFPILRIAAAHCIPAMLLACSLADAASEFVVTVNLQAEGSFTGPFDDIKWNDKISETMSTVLRYQIEDHGDWFMATGEPQVNSSRSVNGGGEYDDGAFGQCTWKYYEHNTTQGQVQGATAGLNVYITPEEFSSADCGVSVGWPGVEVEDTGCTGTFMMFGGDLARLEFKFDVPPKREAWTFTKSFNTNQVDSLNVHSTVSCTVTVQFIPEEIPPLKIIEVITPTKADGQHSFVASDSITVKAKINPPKSGVTVKWTVDGLEAAARIKGFPKDEATTTDASGLATFSFTPADNAVFAQNRHTAWISGSAVANPPIGFEVTAVVDAQLPPQVATLSQAGLGKLLQDEVDILRQEYFDFDTKYKPGRDKVVPSLGKELNSGTYKVQVSISLPEKRDAILAAYRSSTITLEGQPVQIPAVAQVVVGGFRNPRYNAIYSKYPKTSWHIIGCALDLSPRQFEVTVNGKRRPLTIAELHSQVYPALKRAAATQGNAISEAGAQVVDVGCYNCVMPLQDKNGKPVKDPDGNYVMQTFTEDHIHVDWRP